MTAAENFLTNLPLVNLCKPPFNAVQYPAKVFLLTSVKASQTRVKALFEAEPQSIVVVSVAL